MRVVFMGTSAFAVPALAALADRSDVTIAAVYTQPARKAGRGHKYQQTDVHKLADILGLPVRTPLALKSDEQTEALAELAPDLVLVASYGLLLPPAILAIPRHGCINIHASTLPRWRGASPIQQAILHGDTTTGVDFFQMEKGLDTGPVLLRESITIQPSETGGSLHDRLAATAKTMVPQLIERLGAGDLQAQPQDPTGVTFAPKIDKRDGTIDWTRPAREIERMIRAFDPWPGAWTSFGEERLRICAASVLAGKGRPGELIDRALVIGTGDGLLAIETIQRAGRKPLAAVDLLRGFDIPKGSVLGPALGTSPR